MNFIFSEETDFSTNRVIDWLYYYNSKYEKFIGYGESKDLYTFNDKKYSITFGGKNNIESNSIFTNNENVNINSTWFRRPYKYADHFSSDFDYEENAYPAGKLHNAINSRFKVFWDFIGYKLEEYHHLGSFQTNSLNKPIVLHEAQKLGLIIPKTIVTNSLDDLHSFFIDCNKKIITKSIHEVIIDHRHEIKKDEFIFLYQMTKLITELDDDVPKIFAPSLFQEYIDKEYEIRTIYINGECYSAAIFSQLNEQTEIDMRNRDANRPSRYIPYKLDDSIENKLHKLMIKLGLKFGAIDLIKSKDGEYYFLEINPVGQYGDVSMICNYYLHKKIAEYLVNTAN
ncbi:grasp-with-spasm system ATP-grasp peptide maturase [Kordia jejudonensis]|uniref:grasp-with-spasm system ATP-grasp peptide maturase n=1 Tax=Kordia jejudonensis TaxID=1348245 RepID=UPI00069B4EEE|nr:grasp-with-spasm system ATP-grasp peptide maturase [Kordia jejudonensis]